MNSGQSTQPSHFLIDGLIDVQRKTGPKARIHYISGGAGVVGVLSWGVIGALVGIAYSWFKSSQSEKKIAINGCAVIGELIGMFVNPPLAMLLK
jgi:hypothetical protein